MLEPNKEAFGKGTQTWGFAVRLPRWVVDALAIRFPQFNSKDADVRKMAWKVFWETDIGQHYMNESGRKSAKQSQKAPKTIIIR